MCAFLYVPSIPVIQIRFENDCLEIHVVHVVLCCVVLHNAARSFLHFKTGCDIIIIIQK